MSNRFLYCSFALIVVAAFVATLTSDAQSTGVCCAFLGGLIKAVGSVAGSVVKSVGKVVGIGGDSKAPIKVTTSTDPNLTAAIQANNAAIAALASSQQKKSTFPTWGWFAIGGGVLLVGFFLLRRK